jgi:hypothetical protein
MHILNNEHECGPVNFTMDLLRLCDKGIRLNGWEIYYIQEYQAKGQLSEEQSTQHVNALCKLAQVYAPRDGTSRTNEPADSTVTGDHDSAYVVRVT